MRAAAEILSRMENETDRKYMAQALSLAEKGRGSVSPNPMVGAVVVREGVVVGRGYHRRAGEEHAEVAALREAGEKARGATLYVTLEPCCHYGRTPPCTDLIREKGVKRVVAAMRDENPVVCGRGFAILESSGIEVVVGVLEKEARRLNETYLKYITTGTPFVTLKLATTLDGRIADGRGKSRWITGPAARKMVHRMRAWSDAVMVGVGTVLVDDPSLNVRDVEGDDPLRVVVDSRLRTPSGARVLADANVILAVTDSADTERVRSFERMGGRVWTLESENGRVSLSALLKRLGEREVTSVFCEGGGTLAASLLRGKLADKVIFTVAPMILGSGKPAVDDMGVTDLGDAVRLDDRVIETLGEDMIVSGYPSYGNAR